MKKIRYFYRVALLLAACLFGGTAMAENGFYIPSTTLSAGGVAQTLSVNLLNADDITGFQFDISLPNGITLNTTVNDDDETVPDIQLTERKKSKHQISSALQSDGKYRVVVLSTSNQTFRENDGAIVNLSVSVASTVTTGTYSIGLSEIHLVPMKDGAPATRIDQQDYVGTVQVNNAGQSSDVAVSFSIATQQLTAGSKSQTLSIALDNNIDITGFQLDLRLPDGMTVNDYVNEDDETVPNIQLTSRKSSSHSLSSNRREDGSYTIVVLSMKNAALKSASGNLIDLDVSVPITMSGDYTIQASNIHLVPLVNGTPGVRIDLADFSSTVTVANSGSETPQSGSYFSVAPLTLKPGATGTLSIEMNNEVDICSFQMNLRLPEGLSVVKEYNEDDEYVDAIYLSERKKSSHELTVKQTADGGYFLMAYSLQNATFRNSSGSIVQIKVKADEQMTEGTYGVVIANALMVAPSEERFEPEDYSGAITISNTAQETAVDQVVAANVSVRWTRQICTLSGLNAGDRIAVYSPSGQLLYSTVASASTLSLDASSWPTGTIFIHIQRHEQQQTLKVIHPTNS